MSGLILKKHRLEQSLYWLMNVLNLGPGIGEVHFVASANSSWANWWKEIGVDTDHLHTSVANAHANCTANRNDTVLVSPELHTITASIDWTKDHTHLVGLGGENIQGYVRMPNCEIYCDTAAVDYGLHVTANYCQFHNIVVQHGNTGGSANATSYAPVGVAGTVDLFKRVQFRGINTAAQIGANACASLKILYGCHSLLVEDSIIGQNSYGGDRTAVGQGHLAFDGTTAGAPQNGIFRHCQFISRGTTAAVPMVAFGTGGVYAADRLWTFEDCQFDNWAPDQSTIITNVFKWVSAAQIQSCNVRLRRCSASGYSYWVNPTAAGGGQIYGANGQWVMADMPVTGYGGGLNYSANGAVGT